MKRLALALALAATPAAAEDPVGRWTCEDSFLALDAEIGLLRGEVRSFSIDVAADGTARGSGHIRRGESPERAFAFTGTWELDGQGRFRVTGTQTGLPEEYTTTFGFLTEHDGADAMYLGAIDPGRREIRSACARDRG